MNNTEFLFWLQGHFELDRDSDSVLDHTQITVIRDHIKLSEKEEAFSSTFVTGLKALFDLYDRLSSVVEPKQLQLHITRVIRKNLAKQFEKLTPTRDRPDLKYGPIIPYRPPMDCSTPPLILDVTIGDPIPGLAPQVWASPGGDLTCAKVDLPMPPDGLSHLNVVGSC